MKFRIKRTLLTILLFGILTLAFSIQLRKVESAGDLIIDGTTVTTWGNFIFSLVEIKNGGTLIVDTFNGTHKGWLYISARVSFTLGSGSQIIAAGKGYSGGSGGALEGQGDGGGGPGGGGGGNEPGQGLNSTGLGGSNYTDRMGSGGGGGGGSCCFTGYDGGNGGGGVLIKSPVIILNGSIYADGEQGRSSSHSGGAGGGGAGGSIMIESAETLVIQGHLRATGGSGGDIQGVSDSGGGGGGGAFGGDGGDGSPGAAPYNGGAGGGGGGGRVSIYYSTLHWSNTSNAILVDGGGGGWSQQGQDGETGSKGTITLSVLTQGVGGIYIPVDKLELLVPRIGLTTLLAAAVLTVVYVKKRKSNRGTASQARASRV